MSTEAVAGMYDALVVAARVLARVGQEDDEAWAAFSQVIHALSKIASENESENTK